MGPEEIAKIISEYGLPTALTLLFIILYKGQNDKQTKYLFKTISELNDKENHLNDLKKAMSINSAVIEKMRNSITDLNETLKNYLNSRDN